METRVSSPRVASIPLGSLPRAIELFAGVGGFRLGLEASGWQVVWSNQWEPSTKRQHASEVYEARFGVEGHVTGDIAKVLDEAEAGTREIPDHELLVGGFPCQDYSVATSLEHAIGIEGKKGALWWQIYRMVRMKLPPMLLLENVDRLLKSPASQRGRDFAIILACLNDLGYTVEWRVVNAAEYGFPQRRRRVFIVGRRDRPTTNARLTALGWMLRDGDLAQALPVDGGDLNVAGDTFSIEGSVQEVSARFGEGLKRSPFRPAGVCEDRQVTTAQLRPDSLKKVGKLRDVLIPEHKVPESFFIPNTLIAKWRYLKGAKREHRTSKKNGYEYLYSEGALTFPDPLDQPSRTVLTGEGGSGASRFKHVVKTSSERLRRLTPVELEQLNGFPKDWTLLEGVTDAKRAFLMGNALVVGVVEGIGNILRESMTTTEGASRYIEPQSPTVKTPVETQS